MTARYCPQTHASGALAALLLEPAIYKEGALNAPVLPVGRFVALDVPKSYLVVAAVDAAQQIVLQPKRVLLAEFAVWGRQHLRPTDQVVLEAPLNTWQLYDQLVPLVATVTVANPLQVKLIASSRVKTDNRDTLILARLLAAGLIPAVWVPPLPVRELRALVAQRERLIRQRTQVRNRWHAILLAHGLVPPAGDPFAPAQHAWWTGLDLNTMARLQVRQDFALLTSLRPLIAELDAELVQVSQQAPWAAQVPYLLQLPGFQVHNALVLLGAIGDITRFPTATQLVGYRGLGASVHRSGQVAYSGRITKQGRREMRRVLVEAAWTAVGRHPYWKDQYTRLAGRIGENKAIVAIARKLRVVVWHVLTRQETDKHADAVLVARKLVRRAWQLKAVGRDGQSAGARVRAELERLGIGQELTGIALGKTAHRLPPPQEAGAAG